jgi:hypothetical protein
LYRHYFKSPLVQTNHRGKAGKTRRWMIAG